MSDDDKPNVVISNSALSSVAAALSQDPRVVTKAEAAYDAAEAAAVVKPYGHVEAPEPETKPGGKRMYSVTTIAASARYGGTRTVMICDSFELARTIVETGGRQLWEHSYAFAVIESFYANRLYGGMYDRDQYWYRFTWDKSAPPGEYPNAHYQAIEKPEGMRAGEFAVG